MQLLDAGQQLATRPSPNPSLSPGWANNAPATSPPTIADPDSWNAIMAELIQFLTMTGQSASKTNTTQVAAAALMLFGAYGIDSGGTANEYVITPAVPLPALLDGMPVWLWTTRPATGVRRRCSSAPLRPSRSRERSAPVSINSSGMPVSASSSPRNRRRSANASCHTPAPPRSAWRGGAATGCRSTACNTRCPRAGSRRARPASTSTAPPHRTSRPRPSITCRWRSLPSVLTLRFWAASSYGHMPDTTAGNGGTEVIESGGTPIPGDTLVGMVMTNASTQFSPALTRSWFNRQAAEIAGSAVVASTASSTFVDLGASLHQAGLVWAGEVADFSVEGTISTNTAAQGADIQLAIDGSSGRFRFRPAPARNPAMTWRRRSDT